MSSINDTPAPNAFSASNQPQPLPAFPPVTKRRKLALQVAIEPGADGRAPIHEVFENGEFTLAVDSHFERTSKAASAFVARTFAAPPPSQSTARPSTASVQTRAADSDLSAQWPATAFDHVDGAIWELGRVIMAIDALRSDPPVLQLTRSMPRIESSQVANSNAAALLMAKRRSLLKCSDQISTRVKALARWLDADNDFCESFFALRKRCHGVRRSVDGTPLIDVGDSDFVAVRRPLDRQTHLDGDHDIPPSDDPKPFNAHVRINYPAPVCLRFSVHSVEEEQQLALAPVVQETSAQLEDQSIKAVVRRIRLARMSAFRRKTFELLAKQAASVPHVTDLSATCITVDSGPSDLLRIEHTYSAASASSIDVDLASCSASDEAERLQLSSMLQTVAIHGTLVHYFSPEATATTYSSGASRPVLDRLLNVTSMRTLLTSLERVLDDAVRKLGVRLDWTRGTVRAEETRVRIYSTAADGDGGDRLLAIVEPIWNQNSAGHGSDIGHVRITPAFGVIMPAPDDPMVRGRAVAPHSTSLSSGGSALGLDDVPRAYVCPVGVEVLSTLTLLLCIRLLDSFEVIARAGVEPMLDVDRQCFNVIVLSPSNGGLLKAKVWPEGDKVGEEIPVVHAWLNGQRVESIRLSGGGRMKAWKRLLSRLVGDGDGQAVRCPAVLNS